MTKFIAIAPHIVGDPIKWSYCFDFCDDEAKTIDGARTAGFLQFDHDDFIIGEFNNDKCVAVHIEGKGKFREDSKDFGEYIKGINAELGV